MNKPHKHAEVIKAWADGGTLQYYSAIMDKWYDIEFDYGCVTFEDDTEYRIKPKETKTEVKYLWATPEGVISNRLMSSEDLPWDSNFNIKLEWSRTEFKEVM